MSKLETNTIDNISGSSTLTIGDSNTSTITLKSGATLTNFPDNTPAFFVTLSSHQSISDSSTTKIQLDNEILDTDNAFDNSTNYRFTPQTSGKYFIFSGVMANSLANSNMNFFEFYLTKNGTIISQTSNNLASNQPRELSGTLSCIVDMNGSSDYIDMFAYVDTANSGSTNINGHSSPRARTFMGGYKIIGA